MAHNVNLNSSEWCDLVFEGKNKAYGAYAMRQSSTKRHIVAFACVVLFTGAIALIPQFIKAVSSNVEHLGWGDDGRELVNLDLPVKEEEPIVEPLTATPPPPPLVKSIIFVPPVIVDASEVNESNEMKGQDELKDKDAGIISVRTVETDNTVGEDIADRLRENTKIDGGLSKKDDPIVDFADVMPQFPGGQSELMRYLSSNLRYPAIAAETGVEGRVVLKFVVTKDGNIQNVSVIKSLDPSCDQEAMRVVKSMPKWAPGMQNGNKVAVYFNLPIHFKLNK